MTREEIVRMAKEVGYGLSLSDMHAPALERFAALVAAAEREACAKVCDEVGGRDNDSHAWDAAAAIRARGEK
jgi:hypothetical protein